MSQSSRNPEFLIVVLPVLSVLPGRLTVLVILTDYCDRRDLLSSCGCVCCAACLSFNRRLFQDLDDRSCGCSEEIKSDFCFDICIRIGSGFLKLPAVVIPQASEFLANACAGLLPVLAESMCVARKLNASRDERTGKYLEFVGVVAEAFLNLCEGISHCPGV